MDSSCSPLTPLIRSLHEPWIASTDPELPLILIASQLRGHGVSAVCPGVPMQTYRLFLG